MTRIQLIQAVESYATAKSTGDLFLIKAAAEALKALLDKLPEELLPEAKAD